MRPTLQRILFSGARTPLPVWVAKTVQSYEQTVNVLSTAAKNSLTEALTNDPYYYANFGRKTVADWLFVLQTLAATIAPQTITKTGATLRWDCDGTIFNQNSLPAYSRGANDGILICSTTDGWERVFNFQIQANQLIGAVPNWNLPNCTNFRINTNQFSEAVPNWNLPNCTSLQIFSNQFTSLSGVSGYITGANNLKTLILNNNLLNQGSVDLILNQYWQHRIAMAALPGNLTMFMQGGNAAPSAIGLSNRTDIINAFTAAGKTATITTS